MIDPTPGPPGGADPWGSWAASVLEGVRSAGRWRQVRTLDGSGPHLVDGAGRAVIAFASNDYLGLSHHPAVVAAGRDALERWGAGAGSARLVVGARPAHADLEGALADWRGVEAALVCPTGFQANLAVLATLGAGARIVSDELNHASIIDGARLARAEVCVHRHGDADHAASLMASAPGRCLVVSDTVFSMDGDVAPIADLSTACARHGALLVLDDAHLVFPVAEPDPAATVVRVGTLSKALGAQGGYVAASRRLIDVLVNRARPWIFTTAPAPAAMAAAHAAVGICRSPEGDDLRARLRRHIDAVRPGHPTPIVPVVLGSEEAALAAAAALDDAGLVVPAIRPPTVPVGTSRLRVALSAAHSDDDVARLVGALDALTPAGAAR